MKKSREYMNAMCKVMFLSVLIGSINVQALLKYDDPLYPLGQNYENISINYSAHRHLNEQLKNKIQEVDMMSKSVIAVYGKKLGSDKQLMLRH